MDIISDFEKLKLTSTEVASTHDADFCFVDFFKKGSAGRVIFEDHVVPYLPLEDLLAAATTCRQVNAMCRAYTVGEVLAKHSINTSRFHKMELGKFILASVSTQYTPDSNIHRRFIRTETESFWARLYHPSQLPELELAMCVYLNIHGIQFEMKLDADFDWDANRGESTPVLISATFGDEDAGTDDVTVILRYLLMKQGNTELILEPPINGPRYWYNCLFGDPCDGSVQRHVFPEDRWNSVRNEWMPTPARMNEAY